MTVKVDTESEVAAELEPEPIVVNELEPEPKIKEVFLEVSADLPTELTMELVSSTPVVRVPYP